MQLQQQESFEIKGPQLEVFGQIETKLPPAAKKRPTAVAVIALCVVLSVFGIGGAKLKGQYNAVQAVYTQTDAHGNGVQTELTGMTDSAANLRRQAEPLLGADDPAVQELQDAIEGLVRSAATPADQYAAAQRLSAAVITARTAASQAADSDARSRIDAIYQEFATYSANATIYAQDYNDAAEQYNSMAGGFPASLIGTLWGAGEAELYAAP